MKIFLCILFLFCNVSLAHDLGKRFSLNVGTDLYQSHYKEQRYKFDDYGAFKNPTKNISRIAIGGTYRITEGYPIYVGFRTNRLINSPATLKATDIKTNIKVDVHQKFIAESIYLASYVNKYVAPFVVATRLESKTHFIYSSGSVAKVGRLTTLYGFGVAYTFMPKHTIAFTYFLPDDTINTKRAFGFSYAYQLFSLF